MKKRELIEQIIDKFCQYAESQEFPLVEDLGEFREKYTIEELVALVQRFIIPAHESNCLKEYVFAELERYKVLAFTSGTIDEKVLRFVFTEEQEDEIVKFIQHLIEVIQL